MKIRIVSMIVFLFFATTTAFAGQPQFNLSWSGQTISALIGADNVAFSYPANSDSIAVGYWIDDLGQKFSTQAIPTPDANGDFVWQGFVEVGANDPQTSLNFSYSMDNGQAYNWFVIVHRVDTRGLVFARTIEPGDQTSGNFTSSISRKGYDVLVATWNPMVPEPGGLLALGSGLIGFVGFGWRRYR